MRAVALAAILTGVGVAAFIDAGRVHADGVISEPERRYIDLYGPAAVCPTLAQFPTDAGVQGVIIAIYSDGWAIGDAADIVAASIAQFCPSFTVLQRYAEQTGRGHQLASHITSVNPNQKADA
jgi:hypothetical protein